MRALDEHRAGPLHSAARSGSLPVFNRLLEAGADPLVVDTNGETVLHVASLSGCWALTERALEMGGDVEASSKDGRSVLHYAALGENNLELFESCDRLRRWICLGRDGNIGRFSPQTHGFRPP